MSANGQFARRLRVHQPKPSSRGPVADGGECLSLARRSDEEATVDQLFRLMKQQFVDKGIPVLVGEFAAMRRENLTGESLALRTRLRAHTT